MNFLKKKFLDKVSELYAWSKQQILKLQIFIIQWKSNTILLLQSAWQKITKASTGLHSWVLELVSQRPNKLNFVLPGVVWKSDWTHSLAQCGWDLPFSILKKKLLCTQDIFISVYSKVRLIFIFPIRNRRKKCNKNQETASFTSTHLVTNKILVILVKKVSLLYKLLFFKQQGKLDLEHFCSHFNACSINSTQSISLYALKVGEVI